MAQNLISTQPNILEIIDGAPFPLSKVELVEYAQNHDASEEVLDIIQAMPDVIYKSVHEVGRRTSEMEDLPGAENTWSSNDDLESDEEQSALPDGTDHIVKQ